MDDRTRARDYLRGHFNGRHDDFDEDKLAAAFDSVRREAMESAAERVLSMRVSKGDPSFGWDERILVNGAYNAAAAEIRALAPSPPPDDETKR